MASFFFSSMTNQNFYLTENKEEVIALTNEIKNKINSF
jgi:hypothetical protein